MEKYRTKILNGGIAGILRSKIYLTYVQQRANQTADLPSYEVK